MSFFAKKYKLTVSLLLLLLISFFVPQYFNTTKQNVFDEKKILEEISQNAPAGEFLALETGITDIMKTYGLRAGFLLIDEAERQNIITNDQCHSLLHFVGHEGYAEHPYNYEYLTSLVEGTSCIGGFIHGIEAEIVLTSDNIKEDLWDFCAYTIKSGVRPGACFHGVGHAAAELYNYDIPKTLALCDALRDGPETDLSNCYRGTFSELGNIIIGVDGHTGLPVDKVGVEGLNPDNPYLYCQQLEERHQSSCKSQLTKLFTNNVPIEDWIGMCTNQAFDEVSQKICVNITAGVFVRETLSFQKTTTLPETVLDLPKSLRNIAILGSAEAFSGYFADNDNIEKDWQSFCDTSFIKDDDKAYCTTVFEDAIFNNINHWMNRSDIR